MLDHALIVRAATPRDADTVGRLAALSGHLPPRGRTLLAERGGMAVAALPLTSGLVLADPRTPVGDATCMLRHRRYRLLRQGGDVGMANTLLCRLAAAA
ncbi:MAG: hypothetical protein ACJ780_16475 [Solirubrobacteraceae bacterium]